MGVEPKVPDYIYLFLYRSITSSKGTPVRNYCYLIPIINRIPNVMLLSKLLICFQAQLNTNNPILSADRAYILAPSEVEQVSSRLYIIYLSSNIVLSA